MTGIPNFDAMAGAATPGGAELSLASVRRVMATAALSAAIAGVGCGSAVAGQFDTLLGIRTNPSASDATEPLITPREYRSQNGELNVTLEARETQVRLGKDLINGATYNGVYGGPVL